MHEASVRAAGANGDCRGEAGQSEEGLGDPGGRGETGAGERAGVVFVQPCNLGLR